MNVFRRGVLRRKLTKKRRLLGSLCVGLGALLVFAPAVVPVEDYIPVVPFTKTPAPFPDYSDMPQGIRFSESRETDRPVRVIIPSVDIDVPVRTAYIKNGAWEVFDDSAAHGHDSAYPGEGGNVVIYAHARPGLFLQLKDAGPGKGIFVFGSRSWHEYTITETFDVSPDDVSVVRREDSEILTLYTCSGPYDTTRWVVRASPVR